VNRLEELTEDAAAIAERFRGENGAAALMDHVGRLWTARLAAAALLVRERETALDLVSLHEEGWHKLEEEDGRPARWTAKEPVIAFDWPFRAPWQLRLRIRHWHGDAQLRGIEAWCGEQKLQVAVARDASGPLIRIEGRPGDPLDPRSAVRLVLPTTHRPPDDPRDLGVMVTGLTLRAAQASAAPEQALPAAGVRAAAEPDGSWRARGVLGGEVVADGRDPVGLAFAFDVPGGPPVARALALYLNGVPLRLDLTPESGAAWSGLASLPAGVLLRAGLVSHWDLVVPEDAEVRLRSVRAVKLAGTRAAATDAAPADRDGEPPTRRAKWWRGG
jgi:hypothetical protein